MCERRYTFAERPPLPETLNSRRCYVGAERVRDIVNDYDPVSFRLPYGYENRWFRLGLPRRGRRNGAGGQAQRQKPAGAGRRAVFHAAVRGSRRCARGKPTPMRSAACWGATSAAPHAVLTAGRLTEVRCEEHGPVFTRLRLVYALPGTVRADVAVTLYEAVPRIDFALQLGKTLSSDIESVFLPLTLELGGAQALWAEKGSEPYRPGLDQLPGTCMEYTMSDTGIAFVGEGGSALIASRDVPLYYFGEMRAHRSACAKTSRRTTAARGVFLGHEQLLGNELQAGPVRLCRIPLHAVAVRRNRTRAAPWPS